MLLLRCCCFAFFYGRCIFQVVSSSRRAKNIHQRLLERKILKLHIKAYFKVMLVTKILIFIHKKYFLISQKAKKKVIKKSKSILFATKNPHTPQAHQSMHTNCRFVQLTSKASLLYLLLSAVLSMFFILFHYNSNCVNVEKLIKNCGKS